MFRFPLEGGTGAIWKGVSKLLPQDKQVGPASCYRCVLLLNSTDVKHACVSCQFLSAPAIVALLGECIMPGSWVAPVRPFQHIPLQS